MGAPTSGEAQHGVKEEMEDGGVLVGERSKEKEDKNDRWHRVERSSGRFTRRFRLPENAKVEQTNAAGEKMYIQRR